MPAIDTSRSARTIARAEPVGSLLRNAQITAQIEKVFEGSTTYVRPLVLDRRVEQIAELNRLADTAARDLVQRQIDAGLDVVTDGEQRRSTFIGSFYDSVDGLAEPESRLTAVNDSGESYDNFGEPLFIDRVRKAYAPAAEEAAFMRTIAPDFPFKITIPAPSYFLTDFIVLEGGAYESHAAFLEDVVQVTRRIVAEVIAAGARWIQFDFPIYPALVATNTSSLGSMLEAAKAEGETADTLLDKALAADAAATEGIPDDITVAMHLCRGNFEGGFWSGSLAPIAERMFNELPHKRFLFEWEDLAREGDYTPIKHVPSDRVMAMGIVSTKTPELEDEDDVVRRIEAAAEHLPIEQLALCPQCGFASIYGDHLVDAEEAQWRKLELIGRVADRVWGRD
jgi:5-methyltetrahydropteroyltriglutamate--homocysteine methyltransferase